MNRDTDFEKDILGHYINKERIEKAPEGFKENLMMQIMAERTPAAAERSVLSRAMVPAIYTVITLLLIIIAVVFATPSENLNFNQLTGFFSELNLKIPDLKISSLPAPGLPAVIIYVSVGFFLLTLFDNALSRLFRRGR
jgi:hypothetical protein